MSLFTFEPNELDVLEQGLIACEEKQRTSAVVFFERAVKRCRQVQEQQALAVFLQQVLEQTPENEEEWFLRAEKAPTMRARLSCLKMVVRHSPEHAQAWEAMISLCQSLSDLAEKEAVMVELWNCTQVKTPLRLLNRIAAILTPLEELELGERRATALRNAKSQPAEPEGFPLRRFRDWVVTTGGVESLLATYNLDWREIWRPHWEEHLKAKGGALGNYQDFVEALAFARALFPVPSDGPTVKMAQAYKQRLFPKRSNWFEGNRIHTALGGVRVRSKSEVIIANLLTLRQIPFVYEQRLEGKDGTCRFPDFTLTWRTRTYYWEHLGMLEDVGYLHSCEQRLAWYREQGFEQDLIVTTEVGGLNCEGLLKTLEEKLNGGNENNFHN